MTRTPVFAALMTAVALLAAPALAGEDDAPPPGAPDRTEFCRQNPVTCEVADERREARKQWCDRNPEKCRTLKAERHQRMQKWKETCDADPAECERARAQMREAARERREHARELRDERNPN